MTNKEKAKPSGSAVFMYWVIGITATIAAVSLILYHTGTCTAGWIFWTGFVCFTIMYHLWMRIIMGNVTKLWNLTYTGRWFQEKRFEKKLYKILRVKKWKKSALTYNPELYNVKERTMTQIADATAKAETDHWINVLISFSTLLFALVWGHPWLLLITAVAAALFDSQFIVIQRYNRPRLQRLIEKESLRQSRRVASNTL